MGILPPGGVVNWAEYPCCAVNLRLSVLTGASQLSQNV
jgi:hypothetical protein